jgi:N-acetylneuraminic acid mutarotase
MGSLSSFSRPSWAVVTAVLLVTSVVPALGAPPRATRLAPNGASAEGGLSLDERVVYQRRIEEVLWRHKVWPAENARAKPPLDEVMPAAAIRAKAEDALRASAALATDYGRPITPEQLQAEMDRMADQTRQPDLLRELWAALDNDPFVIAECLARPALAERLLRNWYAYDARRHSETRAQAEAALAVVTSPDHLRGTGGRYEEVEWAVADGGERAPEDKALRLSREEWDAAVAELERSFAAGAKTPIGRVGALRESETAFSAVALLSTTGERMRIATVSWPKQPFDMWWSGARARFAPAASAVSVPGPYTLREAPSGACADDTWRATAAQMPGREWHTAVWTGTEMIVWGGTPFANPADYNPAGRYNPATDTWSITSSVGAPEPREKHTAVWTGTEMIVWSGNFDLESPRGTGGRYNPQTDTWAATSTSNAPAARQHHTAVWTGSRMLVWGGARDYSGNELLNTGGSYDPATDSWTALPTSGAPTGRRFHTAVWTGSAMVVWGGVTDGSGTATSTGGRYTPSTNSWAVTPTSGAPSARYAPTAVWTGSEMVVWGGSPAFFTNTRLNTGGRYNPSTNAWTATATAGAPAGRDAHVAVWTGSQMLVWGGMDGQDRIRTGGRYTLATNSWSPMTTVNAPLGAALAEAVWTGSEMIVWGGQSPPIASVEKTGGRYNPQTDSWVPVTPTRNGGVRNEHPAVWTGTEMIVWGSYENFTIPTNTGARYAPATDTWTPTSMTGVPEDRYAPVAVWTGTEMVVWGGCADSFCFTRLNSGGRYNPQTDSWRPTTNTGAPEGRYWFSAVWTGSEVLVWGGCDYQTCGPGGNADPDGTRTGARYDPVADSWREIPVTGATPSGRWGHEAVWTGQQMLVWGGIDGHVGGLGTGARFDLAANAWIPISTASAPEPRWGHQMIWTGSEAVVWGGTNSEDDAYTIVAGGRYNPATDAWRPTSTANAPRGRSGHTAVWTGVEMIVWGGCGEINCQLPINTGSRYNPVADTWTAMSAVNAPPARDSHSAVWTGDEMIVFGGEWGARNPTVFDSGGRYCLAAPSFDVTAGATSLEAVGGSSASTTLTVTSANGFAGPVSLSAAGLPAGVTAGFGSATITPPAGGSVETSLTVTVAAGVVAGTYPFQATATSGGLQRTVAMQVTVAGAAPAGSGGVGLYSPSNGTFFLKNATSSGAADMLFGYGPGGVGLVALSGDWDGDGDDTPGLYNPSNGFFFLKNTNAPGDADLVFSFGAGGAGLVPLVGDWDGDGDDTVGLYAPSNGFFFLRNANAGGTADVQFGFGPGGLAWSPITGDWDGMGGDTVGLYDPSNGVFFLRNANASGAADAVFGYGPSGAGWTALASDWDGDGRDTIGLYAPSNGFFFLRNTNSGGSADVVFGYGPSGLGWRPLAGDWDGQ